MTRPPVLSRHRLPTRYRVGLALLWIMPVILFLFVLLAQHGVVGALLDPRLWLPLLVMTIPPIYVWREGVDVLPNGIITRTHWPRYHAYTCLDNWYLDQRPDRRLLTIWDQRGHKIWQSHAGHLTHLPQLLTTLRQHLRYRHWPY